MSIRITRRDFAKVAGAAALAGVGVLAQSTPVKAGSNAGVLKKALKWEMIDEPEMSVTDKFKMVKEIGFEGVEPTADSVRKVGVAEFAKAIDASGIPVHGIVQGWTFSGINKTADWAKELGATSVLIVTGKVTETMPYAKNWEVTQAEMRKAIPHYEQQEIQLLIENVWNNFQLSPLEMAYYIDELDSEWCNSYFDIGNVHRFGWPEQWIPVLGERIKKLDLKEYSTEIRDKQGPWKGFSPKIGDGTIAWDKVVEELAKINYSGWVTAEVGGGNREHLADIAQRMAKVLDI